MSAIKFAYFFNSLFFPITLKIELDNILFAPTFGAEYFIGNNFSFGGEVRYKILSFEDTETNSSYDTKQEITSIEPKFLVRFYF